MALFSQSGIIFLKRFFLKAAFFLKVALLFLSLFRLYQKLTKENSDYFATVYDQDRKWDKMNQNLDIWLICIDGIDMEEVKNLLLLKVTMEIDDQVYLYQTSENGEFYQIFEAYR